MNEPIAIIGLDARLPGDADSAENFYNLLLNGRSARCDIPADRYNVNSFWHPDSDRGGTARAGHFLRGSVTAFDAPFFSITPAEARNLDPQQRGLLECIYKALENAGVTLKAAAGSCTGVYVGCFSADYTGMQAKDPEVPMRYAAPGTIISMLSNKVSWFFDFRGPSMTLDTACSSSLVAVHQACNSLKLGETSMAIAAGSNLILSQEMTMKLDTAGVLSPDGISYSFDHRANGYSRGEGFGAIVLKRVSDAIRDGDIIRAVIRNSGSNQDGKSPGIMQPTRSAQSQLIRDVYSQAGLDVSRARFIEAHGTGTFVGDPIEVSAISDVFTSCRSAEEPLYVGAVKSNIGHLEGAAGIASVIKCVLTLEHGVIPANTWFERKNSKISDLWHMEFPTKPVLWPQPGLRRLSINSFGVGGTNSHVVMDDALHFLREHNLTGKHRTIAWPHWPKGLVAASCDVNPATSDETASSEITDPGTPSTENLEGDSAVELAQEPDTRIYFLSAFDKDGVVRLRKQLRLYISSKSKHMVDEDRFLSDLSYTLGSKRSLFGWRSYVVADSRTDLMDQLRETPKVSRSAHKPCLGFIFTGQGAQWATMGKGLMAYHVFQQSIVAADKYLSRLGCSWSLSDEICREVEASRINDAEFCQPICTALQVALIDLLSDWGIHPHSVAGHSSGEIAAAYSVGAISRESAWKISYLRGKLCAGLILCNDETISAAGRESTVKEMSMVAVALGKDKTLAAIESINLGIIPALEGSLEIACLNSPDSQTVSGSTAKIDALVELLQAQNVFARKLNVDIAYHSQYMEPIAAGYSQLMGHIEKGAPRSQQKQEPCFFSSLYGTHLTDTSKLRDPSYWVQNLTSPVRFIEAITAMMENSSITDFLELGPHSGLKGPLRSIAADISYHSMLLRNSPDIQTAINMIGSLFCRGFDANSDKVNNNHHNTALMLTDIPGYPFNHSDDHEYWSESRLSRNFRFPPAGRHELLGVPVLDWDKENATWRHKLQVSANFPWVQDHKVSGDVLYPASGMLVMAIEAVEYCQTARELLRASGSKSCPFTAHCGSQPTE